MPVAAVNLNFPLVRDAFKAFMDHVKSESSEATYAWYQEKLYPLYERFHDWATNTISYQDGISYKNWLRHEKPWRRGKNGLARKGVGPTTVNHHLRAARSFLGWLSKPSRRHNYGLAANPWEEIKFLTEKPRERLLTTEELGHLLDQCKDGNVRHGAMDYKEQLLVLRNTTMRPQELRKLKWDYIRWDEHRIVFPAPEVKTRNRREVVLIDVAEDVLAGRKKRLEGMGLKLPGRYVFPLPVKDTEGVLTAGLGDEPQQASKFAQRFRRLIERCVKKELIEKEKAGERLVPYSTRHTRITELFVEGNDHAVVMFDAGHKNPQTTERYKHLAGSHIADAIRKRGRPAASSGEGVG
jgi:integrase